MLHRTNSPRLVALAVLFLGSAGILLLAAPGALAAEVQAAGAEPPDRFRSMPFDASPYPAPPIVYGEWQGINVAFRTSADIVQKLVPEPLKPDATPWGSQGGGDVVVVTQNEFAVIKPFRFNYRNTCYMVPVTYEDRPGLYMARIYEDAEDATLLTIWGREVFGMPKVAGRVGIRQNADRVHSTLRAFGAASTDIALALPGTSTVEPPATLVMYCRKTIPSPDNPRMPDLDTLVEIPWRQTAEKRVLGNVERCEVIIDLHGAGVALPVKEVLHAFWHSHPEGTVLDVGKTVHNYLR